MSDPIISFACGHSCGFNEVRSLKTIRCPTCAREAEVQRGKNARKKQAGTPRNQAEYAGRANDPIGVDTVAISGMEAANHSFLKALYRNHPYVFDAAEKAGRLCVRP